MYSRTSLLAAGLIITFYYRRGGDFYCSLLLTLAPAFWQYTKTYKTVCCLSPFKAWNHSELATFTWSD